MVTKLTNAQAETKKLLSNTITRLAKQSGQTKAQATKALADKLGIDPTKSINEMSKSVKAGQKRKLKDKINYQGGDIVTNTERKNNIQQLNKELRKARNKQGYEATESTAEIVKAYSQNRGKMKYNELLEDVEEVKKGNFEAETPDDLTMPATLPDATKDDRWGRYDVDFDRHILYNLLNGDRLPLLSGNPYNYEDSSDRGYVFNL